MSKKQMKVVRATGTKTLVEYVEELPVALQKDEIIARAKSLTRLRDDQAKVELEFELQKNAHKERISAIEKERMRLGCAIRDGKEKRPVHVQGVAHFDVGQYREIRMDTGELINERPLLPTELQDDLPLGMPTPSSSSANGSVHAPL
jgi:hypothetical protein